MSTQTETQQVRAGTGIESHEFTLLGIEQLANAYQDALFMEADLQKAYLDAQSLTQYRRDEAALNAYRDGSIGGGNERIRKLEESRIFAEDPVISHLEGYEDQALKALTLATVERKRIEAEIGLIKAWLYSQSRAGR